MKKVAALAKTLPAGVDPFGYNLKMLTGAVLASGGVILACFN